MHVTMYKKKENHSCIPQIFYGYLFMITTAWMPDIMTTLWETGVLYTLGGDDDMWHCKDTIIWEKISWVNNWGAPKNLGVTTTASIRAKRAVSQTAESQSLDSLSFYVGGTKNIYAACYHIVCGRSTVSIRAHHWNTSPSRGLFKGISTSRDTPEMTENLEPPPLPGTFLFILSRWEILIKIF
jgi:hypothetical protein